jgi:hypothetical protein
MGRAVGWWFQILHFVFIIALEVFAKVSAGRV